MGQHREIRVKLHNGRPFGGLISLTGSRERSEWRWKKCEVSEFCFTYNYHCGDQRAERRSLYIHPGELVIFGPLGCSDLTVINVPTHLDGIDKVIYYRRFCVYSRNEAVSLISKHIVPSPGNEWMNKARASPDASGCGRVQLACIRNH